MKNIIIRYKDLMAILILPLMLSACLEMEIENPNAPGIEAVELESVLAGAYKSLFDAYFSPSNTYVANSSVEWMADHTTMTNNVLSWWAIFKIEPRTAPFDNSLTFPNLDQISRPWSRWNAAIGSANIVLRQIEANPSEYPNSDYLLASAYFVKGMALGYLANVFDKAYIVETDTDLGGVPVLSPYNQVLEASLKNLDKAIEMLDESDFTLPDNILLGLRYTSKELSAVANTYAAHFMTSSARNRVQNEATDWNKVRAYAEKGISKDFVLQADGSSWYHGFQYGSGIFWYFRIDHRILRHFNSNFPKRFPLGNEAVIAESVLKGEGYNGDKRLDAYFEWDADNSFFNPARGPQLRSHYRIKRYDPLYAAIASGPSVLMYSYANKLYLAEANARLNNFDDAKSILNDPINPRRAVGELPEVTTNDKDELLKIIFAERDIELGRTSWGLPWFDMRRKDALQRGSLLHFPVPADELAAAGFEIYTFGGVDFADGENTADGSNNWLDND